MIPSFVSGIPSVHWKDIINALGDIISALEVVQCVGRDCHQCIGGRGISSVCCNTMIYVGYIISALGVFIALEGYHQCTGGYHQCTGGYHQCLGGCSVHWKGISSVHWGERDTVSALEVFHKNHDIANALKIFPKCTEHPQCTVQSPMHCTCVIQGEHFTWGSYKPQDVRAQNILTSHHMYKEIQPNDKTALATSNE